jgi:hypothetical protein
MQIVSAASAFPKHYHSQAMLFAALEQYWGRQLVVLEEGINNRRPAPGTWGLLAAMGPGFCSEWVALEW